MSRRFPVLLLWIALAAGIVPQSVAATLALRFTINGEPLERPTDARFYLYEPGKREEYLAWGHGAKTVRIPDGEYDLVIRYRNDTVTESIVRSRIRLAGNLEQEIEFRASQARLTVDVTRGGNPIQRHTASWSLYRSGQRTKPLARKRPGQESVIRPGVYDIEVTVRGPDGLESVWREDYQVTGSHHETVELGLARVRLALNVVDGEQPVSAGDAVWRVFPPGERTGHLAEGRAGESLELEAGVYDIGVFHETGGRRGESWLVGVEVNSDQTRSVDVARALGVLTARIEGVADLSRAWCSIRTAGRRGAAVASVRSGEEAHLEPGIYDVGCFLRAGGLRAEGWLRRQRLSDRLELEVELDPRPASLRVLPRRSRWSGSRSTRPQLEIVVDASAEMGEPLGTASRLDLVRQALRDATRDPAGVDLDIGLRVFGGVDGGEDTCRTTNRLVPAARMNRPSVARALDGVRAEGRASLTLALERAASDLPGGSAGSVLLVTGGSERCSGDPCRLATRLVRDGLVGRIFVVGLGAAPDEVERLDCVGRYYPVEAEDELGAALRDAIRRSASWEQGTVALFRTDRHDEYVAGGLLGERIGVSQGSYDVLMQTQGRTYEWRSVEITGELEATAGRRRPRKR